MTFGIILKLGNAAYFGSALDFWGESVPQLLFMLSLFGYVVFLIFFKWSIDWSDPPDGASAPPSLVDTLISIALTPGTVVDQMYVCCCTLSAHLLHLFCASLTAHDHCRYNGQPVVQVLLLLVAFICVPVMLYVVQLNN